MLESATQELAPCTGGVEVPPLSSKLMPAKETSM